MIFPSINFYKRLISCCALMLIMSINSVMAAPGTIADQPIFTSDSAPPVVFFEVDDSGSMDWEILTIRHWHVCSYNNDDSDKDKDDDDSGAGDDCGFEVTNGLYRDFTGTSNQYFEYIYDNNDDAYSNSCNSSRQTLELCSDDVEESDWRVKSSSVNVIYYNPSITYTPWSKGDGTLLDPATFTAAKSNPQPASDGFTETDNLAGFIYHVWDDSHGFDGTRPTSVTLNKNTGANGLVDWWDEHRRFTVNATSITVEDVTYTGVTEVRTPVATLTGTGAHAELDGKTITEVKQNIANWYQYARRRSFVTKAAIGDVISETPDFLYGLNFINNTSFPYKSTTTSFVEAPPGTASVTENTALISGLYNLDWPAQGTPLRKGLERAGKYFDNTDSRTDPIVEECQKNFTILFTDGFWNGSSPASGIGNADGDSRSITVADVADFYYDQDLSPINGNPNADPTEWQRMTTYTVAFGVTGLLTDTDNDGWPGNAPGLAINGDWGNPFNSSPEKIDDLWHAAFNSTGTFISAQTPEDVSDALSTTLQNVTDRIGSSVAVAFNTTTLTGSSSVFLAQFNSTNNQWTGDILSFPLDPITGDVATSPVWNAADLLDARDYTTRNIFTRNSDTLLGVPFEWFKLKGNPQRRDLRTNPDGTIEFGPSGVLKGQARLAYLRGDRSNEEANSGTYTFRNREKLLGDIVDSTPVFIGEPGLFWPNVAPFPDVVGTNTYFDFQNGPAKTRTQMLYVGANDGMLHGFNASTGQEEMAYIPNFLFSKGTITEGLHYLTDTNYSHRFYVDMPPTISDVYIDKGSGLAWHSVLVGGGRAGGRGLFALDITDPSKFVQNDTNAQNLVLWEFDNTDDADLGFTFSNPSIALLNNGRWAAIFGNGYNGSGDGEAKLFILFLDGGLNGTWTAGTDYIEITTGAGSIMAGDCADAASLCNGLSTPQAVDLDGDRVADRIYAGDLEGNIWVFDLSDASAANWKTAYGTVGTPLPLFTATHHLGSPPTQQSSTRQPITSKPVLVRHPSRLGGDPDVLVFFGTGQYLNVGDISNTDKQSFYGVWDNGTPSLTPADLIEQTFISGVFTNDDDSNAGTAEVDVSNSVRITTDNAVDYAGADNGWFINLTVSDRERIIVDPDVRNGLVFFNTWIPNANVCSSGGSGILMSVEQLNGGRPAQAAFDFNGDGVIDASDLVTATIGGVTYTISGELFNLGLPASSNFLSNSQYTPGTEGGLVDADGHTTGQIDKRLVEEPDGLSTGRLSWQELRP